MLFYFVNNFIINYEINENYPMILL